MIFFVNIKAHRSIYVKRFDERSAKISPSVPVICKRLKVKRAKLKGFHLVILL